MKMYSLLDRRKIVMICALAVTLVLGIQLLAVTAWTADAANQGPGIVIVQLSDDPVSDWTVNNLLSRLSTFVTDDLFFPDRVTLEKTSDPYVVKRLGGQIIIYVSHGGQSGIITGRQVTPWKVLADAVSESSAKVHLFTACFSKELVKFGDSESGKIVYTVPGRRPAEVTNVEVISTVKLALGFTSEEVEEYRTEELMKAKDLVTSGQSVHMMDFEEVILSEIDAIDGDYSQTYGDDLKYERSHVTISFSGPNDFGSLPVKLADLIEQYFGTCGNGAQRTLLELDIDYRKNYYTEWFLMEGQGGADPFWVEGPTEFTGGTYSGQVSYSNDGTDYDQISVVVTSGGSALNGVDSIGLNQTNIGGVHVAQQKVDGIWEEPVVGRNSQRTGSRWTDSSIKCDYEYDSSWPVFPYLSYSCKESAEDGDTSGWGVYDNSPSGAITNIMDEGDRCIKLQGGGTGTGYRYPYSSSQYWNDQSRTAIQWSMKYSESYRVYVSCDTTAGHRYIYYTNSNYDSLGTGGYVHHGLGSSSSDGNWHTFIRDLEADLHDAQPSVDIIDVNAILFRGSGLIDDIYLLYEPTQKASGSIHSNGEYIYVDSIPTSGNVWHGPSFVQTLPAQFKLGDLDTFSTTLSLYHNNDDSRLSETGVCLYDENKKAVVGLKIRDGWGAYQRQMMEVCFFRADGSYQRLWSNLIYGDYTGMAQLRYSPNQGIVAMVPDLPEKVLFRPDEIDTNRLIKYIAIQSYRYGAYAEHDERIHNIRLSYTGSEYTVFHDNCNDMDEFHKDLDFGYGTSSDGEFIVPSGASYMIPTDIPNSPSGWHGPNFVHVLDRPFRLYQLSEFSVIGQLIQSSSTLGKSYVALFDENKQIVLLIHWGDAWVGSKKSWFNVYFYPQNGGGYAQSSGYIYNSGFTKTGKLWWDDGFGGDGAIYSTIDGSGDAYPIGECDNASRVIKYVMLLGYRHSHYNLVGMRIHDINVVTDLNAHDPNIPEPPPGEDPIAVENDGTSEGAVDSLEPNPWIQSILDSAQSVVDAIVWWWEGIWPRIHGMVSFATPAGGQAAMHFSVDLLLSFRVDEMTLDTPVDDQLTTAQQETWAARVVTAAESEEGPYADFFRGLSWAVLLTFTVVSASFLLPLSGLALTYAFVGMLTLWLYWICSLSAAVGFGWVTQEFVVGIIGGWLYGVMAAGFTALASIAWFGFLIYATGIRDWEWLKTRLIWSVIAIVFQLVLAAYTYYVWLTFVELSMQSYAEEL